MAVLGVDACREGWVGIRLDDRDDGGTVRAVCASTIADLVAAAGPDVEVVGIDIPIGLPEQGMRRAEPLARRLLGPRSASVFTPPPRTVLEAASHAEAVARCHELCGQGVTRQAFALGPKILEVDAWLAVAPSCVVEVHPELSFATIAGAPLAEPKSTWAGFQLRLELLAHVGIDLAGDLGLAGRRVAVDDVLDAAAVAWSARRVARREAFSLPDPPEVLPGGFPAAIWA